MANEREETAEAKPKSSKYWILIVAALGLIVIGDLAFRFVGRFLENRSAALSASDRAETKGKAPAEGAKAKKTDVKSTLALDPFLVNLADKDEIRFVKATFHLGVEEANSDASKNPVELALMRDTIISLLSCKTSAQILSPEGKNKLREEIRDRINAVAPKTKVQEVFIVEFIVQL